MRKMMVWKVFGSILLLLLLFVGCQSGKQDPSSGTSPDKQQSGAVDTPAPQAPEKAPEKKDDEPAKLVVYTDSGATDESFDLLFGNALRQKFPHYTIEYIRSETGKKIPDLLTAGTQFDLFYHTTGNYENRIFQYGFELDMTPLIKQQNIDLSHVNPSIMNPNRENYGGKIYGLPVYDNTMVLYYNKSIFEMFGIEHPKDGMTWEETLELAGRVTRNHEGKQYVGLSVNPANIFNQNQFSLAGIDPKTVTPTINKNETWKKIYETLFLRPSENSGVIEEIKQIKKVPDHYNFMRDKNVAMYAYSTGLMSAVLDELQSSVDWDIVSLPTFSELKGIGSQPYPVFMGVTSLSQNPDAAIKALQYLVSNENQLAYSKQGIMPVTTDHEVKRQFGSETTYSDKNLQAIFYNTPAPIALKHVLSNDVDRVYRTELMALVYRDVDINTSFRETEEKAMQVIKDLSK